MKVLITGNLGYVGSVLIRYLKSTFDQIELVGYDTGFFGQCLTASGRLPETMLTHQFYGDVRDFPASCLEGVDAVVHLAAVSNDPMGKEFEFVTDEINHLASVRIAELAAQAGVRNFVVASSCSMYGEASGGARKETDPTNPLTAYARSKIGMEDSLKHKDLGEMVFTSLRFATACGMSSRLRLDLVLNDFVAGALASGEITVLSDGSPWRPLIDVEDMARAISWAIGRQADNGGKFLAVNAGSNKNNYQVRDLAAAVARAVSGTRVSINRDAQPDKRSYQVDFSLFQTLAPDFLPQITLEQSIDRLHDGLASMQFSDRDFRNSSFMRLNTLRRYIASGELGADLRWKL